MTEAKIETCMTLLTGKYRALGRFWNEQMRDMFLYQIADWDEYDGERAVRRFVFDDSSGDPARLTGIYRDTRKEHDVASPVGGVKLPGYRIRQLLDEGFHRRWDVDHPGEPIPDEWDKMFTRMANHKWEEAPPGPVPEHPNVTLDPPGGNGSRRKWQPAPMPTQPLPDDEDPFADPPAAGGRA